MFVCRSQATRLLYHILTGLSTTFFAFFKTFQIICLEETILRDSSVRITLSNRAVNTFLKFFTKTSTCINKRYHRPFRIHGTFIDHLLIKKCKILFFFQNFETFRYSFGVIPYRFLNWRLKFDKFVKPTSCETDNILSSVRRNASAAFASRRSFI